MKKNQAGLAMSIVLVIMIPLVVVSGAVLSVLQSHNQANEQAISLDRADTIATTAAHNALARLEANPTFVGEYEFDVDGGTAHVVISDWGSDNADNDGDDDIDEADEQNFVSVNSRGLLNRESDEAAQTHARGIRDYEESVAVVLERNPFDLEINQAVYIDDPLALLDINGNSFEINGGDHDIDGASVGTSLLPAIGVPGDPSWIASQVTSNQEDNIIGAGGTPSIETVSEVDLEATIAALIDRASLQFANGSDSYSGDLGSVDQPVIAHAPGDLSISSGSTGHGILVVEGDLTISGGFEWTGLIISGGSVRMVGGGGGSKVINGGLACLGAIAVEIEISGSVDIQFSSAGIDAAEELLSQYAIRSWIQ